MCENVVESGKNEEEVAQAVEVLEHVGVHCGAVAECDYSSFGASGDYAADVGERAQAAASGEDESLHGRQFGVEVVDELLHGFDVGFIQTGDLGGVGVGQIRADVE